MKCNLGSIDFGGQLSFPGCGADESSSRRKRSNSGAATGTNRHPWHAFLNTDDDSPCGGTLISRTAVVTGQSFFQEKLGVQKSFTSTAIYRLIIKLCFHFSAANCVYEHGKLLEPSKIKVKLGMTKLLSGKKGRQILRVGICRFYQAAHA